MKPETYDEKLDRWRQTWNEEFDRDYYREIEDYNRESHNQYDRLDDHDEP